MIAKLLEAVRFAAEKHRDQRRKGTAASPYINHPIEVAEILATVGGVEDPVVLQAAILHDTVEDTETTPEELQEAFGAEVRSVVEEVTDDKSLPKQRRKDLQVEHAPHLSERAALVKIADKIANVRSVVRMPPVDWSLERKRMYLEWAASVVDGCRGCNPELEALFDEVVEEGRGVLGAEEAP